MDRTQPPMDWSDPDLIRLWGTANLESARDYVRRAAR